MVLLPVVPGLLFATVRWPPARFLRRHGWPPALAAATVLLLFLAVVGGIVAVIAPQLVGQAQGAPGAHPHGVQIVHERTTTAPPRPSDGTRSSSGVIMGMARQLRRLFPTSSSRP